MKLVYAALLGLISADDTTKVWDLTSTQAHQDEANTHVSYGDFATDKANQRPQMRSSFMQTHKAAEQSESESDTDSSSSDDEDVQAHSDVRFDTIPVGFDKSNYYERQITPMFSKDTDDLFMRSMIATYAHEEKSPVVDQPDGSKTGGEPIGKFWMNKEDATSAAKEVLSTHKGLTGAALDQYLNTFFEKSWGHFDVNKSGWIEVIKMPQFCRFLASDQWMSLKESG